MLNRIRQWSAPPVFEDEGQTRSAALLNGLLLLLLAATILGTAIVLPLEPEEWIFNAIFGVLLTGLFLWFRRLVRQGRLRGVSYVLASVLWVSITVLVLMGQGVRDSSVVGYFLVITFASLLLGGRGVWIYGILSVIALTAMYVAEIVGLLDVIPAASVRVADWMVINLVLFLTASLSRSAVNALDRTVTRLRENEIALAASNRALQAESARLEARTNQLEHRTSQLRAITELGRITTTIHEQEALCATVPKLIGERLELDYVELFLVDEARAHLVLRGGYSSSGTDLLLGRELPLRADDVIATTAIAGEARLLAETDDAAFPETHSRLVLPIAVEADVLGVLDLHSASPAAFNQQDRAALQGLADQLAVALESVKLFAETQETLEVAQRAYGEISSRAWGEMLRSAGFAGFRSREHEMSPLDARLTPEIEHALREKQLVHIPGDAQNDHLLVLPIKVRDRVIGVVDTYKPGHTPGWTETEIEVLQELSERLGMALESARLYEDTQRRAARERLTGEVAARIRETLDLDSVMQTAAREIRDALGLHDVVVQLEPSEGSRDGA